MGRRDPEFKPISTEHSDAVQVEKIINQEELEKLIASLQPERADVITTAAKAFKTFLEAVLKFK